MDAFEQVVAEALSEEGYWVKTSVKVDLTKAQKRKLRNPSMPRPELDIVAYRGESNAIKVVECKSYLDSRGVVASDVIEASAKYAKRYKLFHNSSLRAVVFNSLRKDFERRGLCRRGATVTLCLACGRIASDESRNRLKDYFDKRGWELFDDVWLKHRLRVTEAKGYENQVSTIVVKLLER